MSTAAPPKYESSANTDRPALALVLVGCMLGMEWTDLGKADIACECRVDRLRLIVTLDVAACNSLPATVVIPVVAAVPFGGHDASVATWMEINADKRCGHGR